MKEFAPYLVDSTSPVMEIIKQTKDKISAMRVALVEFSEQFPGSHVYATNTQFRGIVFCGDIPEGWRLDKSGKFYVPNRNTKAGVTAQKAIDALPKGIDGLGFSYALDRAFCRNNESFSCFAGQDAQSYLQWSGWEEHGDATILKVPLGATVSVPPGCTELKMSEYYAIVEKHAIDPEKLPA